MLSCCYSSMPMAQLHDPSPASALRCSGKAQDIKLRSCCQVQPSCSQASHADPSLLTLLATCSIHLVVLPELSPRKGPGSFLIEQQESLLPTPYFGVSMLGIGPLSGESCHFYSSVELAWEVFLPHPQGNDSARGRSKGSLCGQRWLELPYNLRCSPPKPPERKTTHFYIHCFFLWLLLFSKCGSN